MGESCQIPEIRSISENIYNVCLCGGFTSQLPIFQYFRMFPCRPGLNQYLTKDKVSCSRTQHSTFNESQSSDPSTPKTVRVTELLNV